MIKIRRICGRMLAPILCVGIAVFAWYWRFDELPPALYDDLAVAAGLRPPESPVSLHWQLIAAPLCRAFGLPAAMDILRMAGHVALGLFAAVGYLVFHGALPASFRRGEHISGWWRAVVRVVLFTGVVLLCCADPVWNAFRWFSPVALQLLEAEVAVLLVFLYLQSGSRVPLFAAFALLGVLTADSPLGAVVLAVSVVIFCVYVRNRAASAKANSIRSTGDEEDESPFADLLTAWWLTLAFFVGLAAGAGLEAWAFVSTDGLEASKWSWGDYALDAPFAYLKWAYRMISPVGLVVFLGIVLTPALTAFKIVPRATHDDQPFAYFHGAVFAVCGLLAFTQLSGAKVLWFWTWGRSIGLNVRSGLLEYLAAFLCALTVVWSLAVFMFNFYLRNSRRLAMLRYPDALEEEGGREELNNIRRVKRVARVFFLAVPVLLLAGALPFRDQRVEHAMLGVVDDAVRETVRECGDAEYVFTDGGLDAALELAAAVEGRRIVALSLTDSTKVPRNVWLRTRGLDDEEGSADAEDRALLEMGSMDALRTWMRKPADKARPYVVQIGFDIWKRDGLPSPKLSGLTARPGEIDEEEEERGTAAARALMQRMLAIFEKWKPDDIADRALRDAFTCVQWRLAVVAQNRADAYDAKGETELAMEETRLAGELDKNNTELEKIRDLMELVERRRIERMTPREGLQTGLARADFARARSFAEKILETTPNDLEANFAVGMDFFVRRQYSRAEVYLRRCLDVETNSVAVLNNLAHCRLRQGDFAEALPLARRALELRPESREVQRTMAIITAGLEEQQKKKTEEAE